MPVRLEIDARLADAPEGASLFDCAESLGVRVPTSCHKNGKCRECLVEVESGMELLAPRSPEEAHLDGRFRLSCRARIAAASGRLRCHTLRRGAMRIEEGAEGLSSIDGPIDPAVTRHGGEVLLDGAPIARGDGPLLGLAVDAGTTTVVLRLVDLESGAALASSSFENPQRFGGSDVMARIRYDGEHPGRLLQRTLLGYLAHAIEELPCDPKSIFEVAVAGNSTMRDLFFGLDVHGIGQRPYRSVTERELIEGKRAGTSLETTARRLRLPVHPEARVYGLPLISGHVGADAAACVLACGLMDAERPLAVMDIGTNTEIAIGGRSGILVASCPAGPAFEGGLIDCGMPALEGAIESVQIGEDGAVEYRVIGGGEPLGICGSGLVDVLGELRRTERMDAFGRLVNGSDRFVIDERRGLFVSEADISQLAQAKGANAAGVEIAIEAAGLAVEDIDVFYLAGGFAKHIDVDAARRIGLIPDLPDDKILQVGNASIEGAGRALLSVSRRRALEAFVRGARHVELETCQSFFDRFVDGCLFLPLGSAAGRRR